MDLAIEGRILQQAINIDAFADERFNVLVDEKIIQD